MTGTDTYNRTFGQAALEHLDALYGYATALTRDRTEAEDLVQETYVRALRAFGQLLPDSNVKGWLFTIMRNIWLNQVRHKRVGPEFVELETEPSEHSSSGDVAAHDPYMILVGKVERERVRDAIERLPQSFREIVVLRDIEEFSYQQIAAILQCPAGTVMSRLARAREQLRALLSERRPAAYP